MRAISRRHNFSVPPFRSTPEHFSRRDAFLTKKTGSLHLGPTLGMAFYDRGGERQQAEDTADEESLATSQASTAHFCALAAMRNRTGCSRKPRPQPLQRQSDLSRFLGVLVHAVPCLVSLDERNSAIVRARGVSR